VQSGVLNRTSDITDRNERMHQRQRDAPIQRIRCRELS
jgi:hypothetical protein